MKGAPQRVLERKWHTRKEKGDGMAKEAGVEREKEKKDRMTSLPKIENSAKH